MISEANSWITLLLGLCGVVVLVASVVAYFRASLATATIKNLRENNEAQEKRIEILEANEVRGVADKERLKIRVDSLERENMILRDALSGKADIERVIALLEHHHGAFTASDRDFLERWERNSRRFEEHVRDIRDDLLDIKNMFGTRRGDHREDVMVDVSEQ